MWAVLFTIILLKEKKKSALQNTNMSKLESVFKIKWMKLIETAGTDHARLGAFFYF